jgi:hypothetical protein
MPFHICALHISQTKDQIAFVYEITAPSYTYIAVKHRDYIIHLQSYDII